MSEYDVKYETTLDVMGYQKDDEFYGAAIEGHDQIRDQVIGSKGEYFMILDVTCRETGVTKRFDMGTGQEIPIIGE